MLRGIPNETRIFGGRYTWRYDVFPRKLTNGILEFRVLDCVKETHRRHALCFPTLCVWVSQRRRMPYAPQNLAVNQGVRLASSNTISQGAFRSRSTNKFIFFMSELNYLITCFYFFIFFKNIKNQLKSSNIYNKKINILT